MSTDAAQHCVAVAYSGGRDSTALLHATLAQARSLGVGVLALHVHHGLSPQADGWLTHCTAQCRRWAGQGDPLELVSFQIATKPARGESVEAWARHGRYQALRAMALSHGAAVVLLAHHQRDQAETLWLQALRGAGVAGLSGMPRVVQRDGVTWLRPWLDKPRDAIEAYLHRHRLHFIDDDSNSDPRFARNRLRAKVWPALTVAFPRAEASMAAAATWAQQATSALRELADLDLAASSTPAGLKLDVWLQLSDARRSNALRTWLRLQLGQAASAALVIRLLAELPTCGPARWLVGSSELRRHKGLLIHRHLAVIAVPAAPDRETSLCLRRAGTYALPGWGGSLRVERVRAGGVPLAGLDHLDLLQRSGAERFQAGPGRPPRSLKLQFQAAGVPAWERDGPLMYCGGQLVFVPGLGLDARVIGLPGQVQVRLTWDALPPA